MRLLSIVSVGLILSFANPVFALNVEIFKDVLIETCAKGSTGCAPRVSTDDGNSFLLDQAYSQEFLKKHDHLKSKESKVVGVQEIMGVKVKEKGHFPNPGYEFDVIKPIRIIE